MSIVKNYIVVDDDPINNAICCMLIKKKLGDVEIKVFELPEQGLDFLQVGQLDNANPTIIFLDINMPTLSGWEFMEEFEKLSEDIKKHVHVYIVSSSVDQTDKDKAKTFPSIRGHFIKPLDAKTILSLAGFPTGSST